MSSAKSTTGKDLVVGLGVTGLSIARYLKRKDANAIFYDSREEPPGLDELESIFPAAQVQLGKDTLPTDVTRVIANETIGNVVTEEPDAVLLRGDRGEFHFHGADAARSTIELFASEATKPFVAVTGSNGKSTVTTLLYHMCRADGRKTLAGGNLGEPALDLLDEETPDIYVLELSSFQLQRTSTLPAEVAVLLNISPDHLDWHADEAEYREAKYRIFKNASAAVINRADAEAAERSSHCGRVVSFGLDAPGEGHYGIRNDEDERYLATGDALLLSVRDLSLYGIHNQANALAALAAGELIGLDRAAMLQVLVEFPGLPHRMQFVARIGAVDFINDSKHLSELRAKRNLRW